MTCSLTETNQSANFRQIMKALCNGIDKNEMESGTDVHVKYRKKV